jgi:hypothetical protein
VYIIAYQKHGRAAANSHTIVHTQNVTPNKMEQGMEMKNQYPTTATTQVYAQPQQPQQHYQQQPQQPYAQHPVPQQPIMQ